MKRILAVILVGALSLFLYSQYEKKLETEAYTVQGYNIYLTSEIFDTDAYRGLIVFINEHQDVKEMNVYLAGNGGSVTSLLQLVNAMRASPTKFHGVVYGDVYSAHAALAMNMDSLTVVNENILFMFHRPAIDVNGVNVLLPVVCNMVPEGSVDRGVDMKGKCERYMKAVENSSDAIVGAAIINAMTDEEVQRYKDGDDVILTYEEIEENRHANQ